MTIEMLERALMWCLIFNYGLLLIWFAAFLLAHDWIYRMHTRWFTLSVEKFDEVHYFGMAVFKIFVLVFNLAPFIALHIVG